MKLYTDIRKVSALPLQQRSVVDEMLTILAYNRKNYAQKVKGLQQKKITSVSQEDNNQSNADATISLYFKDDSNFRIAVKNGQKGLTGRQGKIGPQGDKGDNFDPDYNVSKNYLVIANDRVSEDSQKILSALQGVQMYEEIEALCETYMSEYQYALLYTDHVTIEAEFETVEDGQLVQLIASDEASHKRYVKYWTFESEGDQEYFVLNHFASNPEAGIYTYDSVYCDLWNDIFLGGIEGYFEATSNQLSDGSKLYIYDAKNNEYSDIEQFDPSKAKYDSEGNRTNLKDYDWVYGERRFKYYLKGVDANIDVIYTPVDGYDFNLDANELTIPIYVFDKMVNGKMTYVRVENIKDVDPKGTTVYYTPEGDDYVQIENVESFIAKRPLRYYKRIGSLWHEVESISDINTDKYEEYMVAEYDNKANTTRYTRYTPKTTYREGTFYVVSVDTITPYTIVYYIYDNDRQYFTRRILTTVDGEGNTVFDYEYTRIKVPFWFEAEFLTEVEDQDVLLISSDTHYDSDEEIVEPVYIESIEFSEHEVTIAKNRNKNVPVMIYPEDANQTNMILEYDEDIIQLYEDGRIVAIESDEISVSTTISVYSEDNQSTSDTLKVNIVTPIERIDFESSDLVVYPGHATPLNYVIYPEVVSNPDVMFEISDTDMVMFDENHNLIVKMIGGEYKTGYCTLTTTAKDGFGATASVSILVADPITSLRIVSQSFGFVNKPFDIETIIAPDYATEKSLEYWSSDESIITISDSGRVTPKSVGNATIYARTKDGSNITASQNIGVTIGVDEIKLYNFDIDNLDVGLSKDIVIEVLPKTAHNKNIDIIVSDISTIEYTEPVLVEDNKYTTTITAVKNGTTQFAVMAVDGTGVVAEKDLTITVPVGDITLNEADLTMYVGDPFTMLRPIIGPAETTNQNIEWHTSNEWIASVDTLGRVTPKNPGFVIISAISNDGNGVVASCNITVKRRVASIKLNVGNEVESNEVQVVVENYAFINANVEPGDASDQVLRWVSSDEDVVTVEDNGTVYGKSVGEAVVTATSIDLGSEPASKSILVKVVEKISGN